VGQISLDGLSPFDLPEATHADAHVEPDRVMLSFRFWRSQTEWSLVRVVVPRAEAHKLAQQIGDGLTASDSSTII